MNIQDVHRSLIDEIVTETGVSEEQAITLMRLLNLEKLLSKLGTLREAAASGEVLKAAGFTDHQLHTIRSKSDVEFVTLKDLRVAFSKESLAAVDIIA